MKTVSQQTEHGYSLTRQKHEARTPRTIYWANNTSWQTQTLQTNRDNHFTELILKSLHPNSAWKCFGVPFSPWSLVFFPLCTWTQAYSGTLGRTPIWHPVPSFSGGRGKGAGVSWDTWLSLPLLTPTPPLTTTWSTRTWVCRVGLVTAFSTENLRVSQWMI